MKQTILISIILILTSIGWVFPQEILFQDDFESYKIDTFPTSPWIMRWDGNDAENQIIVDNKSVSGSQSLKLECAPGWAATSIVRLSLTPPIIYCEGYVMADQTEYGPDIGFNNPDIGTWGTGFARLKVLQTCEANTWYHLKLKYDSYRDVCDYWVDGVLKGKDKPCPKNGEYSVFAMSTMHYTISSKAWYDDIKVYADSLIMMPYIFFYRIIS